MLDDRDMLTQLCEHYCLCWAYNFRSLEPVSEKNLPDIQFDEISISRIT